jgi:hypothetical protein
VAGEQLMRSHDPLDLVAGDAWEFWISLDPVLFPAAQIADLLWRLDSLDGTQNYASLSLSGGQIVFEDTNCGVVIVTVPATDTAALAPGNYRDWARVTMTGGATLTAVSGIIRVAAQPA